MAMDYAPTVVSDELDVTPAFKTRIWTESGNLWGLYNDFNIKLYNQLPEQGFNFPVSTMNVNLNK